MPYTYEGGYVTYCEECDCYHNEYGDNFYEHDLVDSDRGYSDSLIHDWSYVPPRFIYHGNGPTFLGLELELETDDLYRAAHVAQDALGDFIYLKEDGSLSSGFEIVTHPASYVHSLDTYRQKWVSLCDELRSFCFTRQGTGIHVHISKTAFYRKDGDVTGSRCALCRLRLDRGWEVSYVDNLRCKNCLLDANHVYRWLKFWHRNRIVITRIARRESYDWAPWNRHARMMAKDIAKGVMGELGRYQAINTTNPDTFEVRVFRSSLRGSRVFAALGLVDATAEYTRELSAHDIVSHGAWGFRQFTEWLSDRRQNYADLIGEIEDRVDPNLIETSGV